MKRLINIILLAGLITGCTSDPGASVATLKDRFNSNDVMPVPHQATGLFIIKATNGDIIIAQVDSMSPYRFTAFTTVFGTNKPLSTYEEKSQYIEK